MGIPFFGGRGEKGSGEDAHKDRALEETSEPQTPQSQDKTPQEKPTDGSEESSSSEDRAPEQEVETPKEEDAEKDEGTFAANAKREREKIADEKQQVDWVLSRSKRLAIAVGKGLGKAGAGAWEFSKNRPRIAGGTVALGVLGVALYFALSGEVDTEIITESASSDTPPEDAEGGEGTPEDAVEYEAGGTPFEGGPDAQDEGSSSPESPEPELEIPAEVSVVAQPGDGAITMLMRWAETAEGQSFPEGSPMDQLISAQENDALYETAQRIAIDSGLYQPNEVNESFNVHIGARLGTVVGSGGDFSFTLSNPGENSGAHTLWSDTAPDIQRYEGGNMLDTTPRESTNTNTDPEEIPTVLNESVGTDIGPEEVFAHQASALHLTDRAWNILSSETIPEVFASDAGGTAERTQALIELAEAQNIALTDEGASELTKLITLTADPQMAERYGEVSLQQGGDMRTIRDFLLDGFRTRGTGT